MMTLLGCNLPNQDSKPELDLSNKAVSAPLAPVEVVNTLYDETTYIVKEGAFVYGLNAKGPILIKIQTSIEGDVPVDIIFDKAVINVDEYLKVAKRILINKEINESLEDFKFLLGESEASDESASLEGIFNNSLSKKGAYKQYETKWVRLEPGDYSLVIDNTDLFTPTRGDAPVNVQVFYKDILESPVTPEKKESSENPEIKELLNSSEQS